MKRPLILVLSILFTMFIFVEGCGVGNTKKYSRDDAKTYAGLLALHEREKLQKNVSDSAYQIRVAEYFHSRNLNREAFQKQISDLQSDDIAWRAFIAESITLLDSAKSAIRSEER